MGVHELAGQPAPKSVLVDVGRLIAAYYNNRPDLADPGQRVSFGTSGHRGSSLKNSFNQAHIIAVSKAICEYRRKKGVTGPLFLGMDTHALSRPALETAVEVFAADGVLAHAQKDFGFIPTPVISHAILTWNKGRRNALADGVVVTPSHNPPEDGGFKYNPPHGGPAGAEETQALEERANEILVSGLKDISRIPFDRAWGSDIVKTIDMVSPYIKDLAGVVDMKAIAGAKINIGVDPLGGAAIHMWEPIKQMYGLQLEVVNTQVDPTFSFMTLDRDGKIRMDCSSPYAMAGLIKLKDKFDIAFGNDTDVDRHGIVTRSGGLLNPNHFLSAAIWYLFQNRPAWGKKTGVGKTLVSTSMIDAVAGRLKRKLTEVPVGFKWFVEGLLKGALGFAGEESAGASFLKMDGSVWTTDKDGIVLDLLACEMTAKLGRDPAQVYRDLEGQFGRFFFERIDAPASARERAVLKNMSAGMLEAKTLAGDPIHAKLTTAPGNNAPIGGLKVASSGGWFAARPSGTEDVYKIYAESFKSQTHLRQIQEEAVAMVTASLKAASV
jgi:phosphoglucomutase